MNEKLEKIILENQSLIKSIAYKYSKYSNYEDLYQTGTIGIIKAFNNYKETSETKFTTYAYKYIMGEMLKFITMDRNIKVSSDYLKLFKACEKSKEFLTQKFGKEPTINELSIFMGIEEKQIEDAYIACEFTVSLDKELNNEEGMTRYEVVGEVKEENYGDKIMVNDALNNLPNPERELIRLRYYNGFTQSETAEKLGISQVQVSRIERKAKEMIRMRVA